MEFLQSETSHLFITGIFSFLTGGGLVNLYETYRKGEEKEADDMSSLSYQFRKKLSDDLKRCNEEKKEESAKVLALSIENAKLKAKSK